MKLLLQKDRLTLRITRDELAEFIRVGEFSCDFSRGGILPFQVFLTVFEGAQLSWENLPGGIRILVPHQLLNDWALHPDRLGLVRKFSGIQGQVNLLVLEIDLHDGADKSTKKLNEHTHFFFS